MATFRDMFQNPTSITEIYSSLNVYYRFLVTKVGILERTLLIIYHDYTCSHTVG